MQYLTPKYVALLALIAASILVVGTFLRPVKKQRTEASSDTTETPLHRISREAELKETADFLSERMREMGKYVVYLPDFHASAIAWGTPPVLVTTDNVGGDSAIPKLSLLQVPDRNNRPLPPTIVGPALRQGAQWAALVARSPEGDLVWAAGLAAGDSPAHCEGVDYHEVAFNAPVSSAFAGGGLFDLSGHLMGIVATCGDKLLLVAANELESLLRMADSLDAKLWLRYGMRLAPLDDRSRKYFEQTQGLLVTEICKGGLADQAGLVPGDVVSGLNDQAVTEMKDLASLEAPVSSGDVKLTIQHSGAPKTFKLPQSATTPGAAQTAGLETESPPRGVPLVSVAPRSAAQKAGLHAGDHVWQVGSVRVATREDLSRQISAAGNDPVWVLYDRGPLERGVLLERP